MKILRILVIVAIVVLGIYIASSIVGYAAKGFKGSKNKDNNLCPKLSQASLDLDTPGCPTELGDVACELRTHWEIEKFAVTDSPIIDPQDFPILYNVKIKEGKTDRILSATGQIVVTNSGEQTPFFSSVVVNLQDASAKPFTVSTAIAVKDAACKDGSGVEGAQTCFGQFTDSTGASLLLRDPNSNDVIALSEVPIPPTQDFDDVCTNAVVINFEAEFDLEKSGLDAGDRVAIEVLTTFSGAGGGSGSTSCTIDSNCNGLIDSDNENTCGVNEGEKNSVHTIKQRDEFIVSEFGDVCGSVVENDFGASSLDPSCVSVSTNHLNDVITKSGEGSIIIGQVAGTVSCINGECKTDLVNSVELKCSDGRDELINSLSTEALIEVACQGI